MSVSIRRQFTSKLLDFLGQRRFEALRYQYYRWFKADLGYSKEYFEGIHAANHRYYDLFAATLMAEFQPRVLIDCGCGHGEISKAFLAHGCHEVFLFDGSAAAVEMAKRNGLKNVAQLDFTAAESIPAKGDLSICLEVAEHVPARHAARLCALLAAPSPVLAFTAAAPGQGGHLHVNTQPQSYWIELFSREGMKYDPTVVQRVRAAFNGRMLSDYDDNLMVFRRANSTAEK